MLAETLSEPKGLGSRRAASPAVRSGMRLRSLLRGAHLFFDARCWLATRAELARSITCALTQVDGCGLSLDPTSLYVV